MRHDQKCLQWNKKCLQWNLQSIPATNNNTIQGLIAKDWRKKTFTTKFGLRLPPRKMNIVAGI